MTKLDKKESLFDLKALQAEIAELNALEATVQARLQARIKRAQAARLEAIQGQADTFPPPGSLYARWQIVLGRLEARVLELAEAVADALEKYGERNLFDLIAATNSLLDLLDRLHEKAALIKAHTMRAAQGHLPPPKHPLEVSDQTLFGLPE